MRASSDQLPRGFEGTPATGLEVTPPGNPGRGCSTRLLYLPHPSRLRACGPLHHCKNDSRYLKTGPQRTSRRRQGSITRSEGRPSHARGRLPGTSKVKAKDRRRDPDQGRAQQGRAWSAQAPRHGSVVDFPHYKCCDVPFQLRINPRPSAFSLHTQTLRPVTVISLISGLPKVELDNLSNAAPRPRFDPAAV